MKEDKIFKKVIVFSKAKVEKRSPLFFRNGVSSFQNPQLSVSIFSQMLFLPIMHALICLRISVFT